MDRMRALETFIAVGDIGSFAGAARKLNVSPPSITRIIGDLEAELGVVLLQRTTRIVTLTEIGRHYLEDAKKIVKDFELANDAARGAHKDPTGHLRVTASTLFGKIYILPLITQYLYAYPNVTAEGMFSDRVVNIREEEVDVAIRIGNLEDSDLMASKVGQVRSLVCGAPMYFERFGIPQTPSDLDDHNPISLMLANSKPEWVFKDNQKIAINPRLTFTSVPASIAAAKSGWGLARVLSYQIGPDLEDGSLQTVLHDFSPPPLPIHVIHGMGRRSSAKVRAFVDLSVESLRKNQFLN